MTTGPAEHDLPAFRLLSEPVYKGAFVDRYDALRPRPPSELFDLLLSRLGVSAPELVVDLGAGTGISTIPWASRARRVVGVDVNPDMLSIAATAANVEYRHASADKTGLDGQCADLVTCGQSFHWMEPGPTLTEVARLLRRGGLFAAYDYDWPPEIEPDIDEAFLRLIELSGVDPSRPEKAQHLARLRESGLFRDIEETQLVATDTADAERIALLPLTLAFARKISEKADEAVLALERFQELVHRRLSGNGTTLSWRYRVRIARK